MSEQNRNGWPEYRRLIVREIEQLHSDLKAQGERISELERLLIKWKAYFAIGASVLTVFINSIPHIIEKWFRH